MNFRNLTNVTRTAGLAAAALAGLAFVAPARASSVIDLTLTVDQVAKTWKAFATVVYDGQGPANNGLDGIKVDITSSGNILVPISGSSNKMPVNNNGFTDSNSNTVPVGFTFNKLQTAITTTDLQFTGGQSTTFNNDDSSGSGYQNIVVGYGQPGISSGNLAGTTVSWGDPALLATGKYTGTSGTLSIGLVNSTADFNLLDATYVSPEGNVFSHGPDQIVPQTVSITAAPEPAGLGLLAIGSLGVLARRRKA